MMAAAASWDGLCSELGAAAESFTSVTAGLPWQGAAAQAVTTVATQYAQFLSGAAAQAGGAAAQAKAISGIFEAAKAAITHPGAVSFNRQQLMQLVRTNLFGFNCPAIAAVEGLHESMWAKNVSALAGYHGAASAVAAQLAPWQQALKALPGAASESGLPAVQANTKANVADVQRANTSDLARTQALSRSKLTEARDVLTRTEQTAAAAAPAARVQQAARLVGEAAAVNAGTGLRVTARSAALAPLSAGQAGDILGGAGVLNRVPIEEYARAVAVNPLLAQGGGDSPTQTISAYNQNQMAGVQRLTDYQLATTHELTRSHLAAARSALTGSAAAAVPTFGGLQTAAHEVAQAAALNVGTGLQVGAERAFLSPSLLGADLDILGNGQELLYEYER
jgi:PPE-repeat protein